MATNTTCNNLSGTDEVTDAEVAAYSLDNTCVALLLQEPFFAEMLRRVTKIKSTEVPTAGVCVKDSDLYLYWNAKFMASLLNIGRQAVLKHEVYHLVFQHCTSRRMTPHNVHNIATDLAINSLLSEEELPKCALRPGRPLDLSKCTDTEVLAKWTKVSDKIAGFPLNMASDWYFSALMDDPETKEALAGNPGEGEGEGEGIPGGSMDGHEGWGDMSDEEKAVVNGKIKTALSEAVKKCDRNGQWGSVSGDVRETLRKMVDDSVDWKKILRNFVGTSQRLNKSSTLRRLNRKYPYVHPGVQRSRTATVGIFVDMSGSVGNTELEQAYAVLGSLAKMVTFKFYPFDSEVDDKNAFTWKKGQKKPPIRYRAGGTSFIAVNDFVKKHREEFDGVIVITDGCAEAPGPSAIRRCWVLVPETKLAFPTPSGDMVVQMDKVQSAVKAA